ncbi:hypothetical protein NKDENANG_00558 [Candidatus Entotheonellaceae bacterium PAL068K]
MTMRQVPTQAYRLFQCRITIGWAFVFRQQVGFLPPGLPTVVSGQARAVGKFKPRLALGIQPETGIKRVPRAAPESLDQACPAFADQRNDLLLGQLLAAISFHTTKSQPWR